MPLRKKLRLQLVHEKDDKRTKAIHLRQGQTGALEWAMYARDVDHVFCLPVPDKAQRQKNFVITAKEDARAVDGAPMEPVVFTVNEAKGKHERVSLATHGEDDTLVDVALKEVDNFVKSLGKQTIQPDEREFASAIVQAHRKNEKAYHVKAFRGSKEGSSSLSERTTTHLTHANKRKIPGYLFFLPTGIIFGFKKPLLYFPFSHIHSVSFTSVLQRTFNLVITSLSDPARSTATEPETTEYEFSMLDQADFAGIDAYVKRHGLNDASMAAERRAKAYNVNKDKNAGDGEEGGEADAVGELEKAQQQIEDEEDEEEEDYDPGSEGESEGEGESSEEEEGADGGGVEDGEEEAEEEL